MDYIRYALLAGLAVVTYLLLLAWNEDYGNGNDRQEVAESPAMERQDDVPQAPTPGDDSVDDDLPDASTAPEGPSDVPELAGSDQPDDVIAPAATESLIRVHTDVLNVHINPVGGDIVHVSLPQHAMRLDRPDEPFVLLEETSLRSYVAQSGLIGRNGIDSNGRASYSSDRNEYELVQGNDQLHVDLRHVDEQGVEVTKRFSFRRGDHLIDVTYEVNNPTDSPWQANQFGQIKRGNFEDPTRGTVFGMSSFLGFATTSDNDNYIKIDFGDIESGRAGHETEGGWVAFSQHYFLSAWIPPETRNSFSFRRNARNEYIGGYTSTEFVVAPNSTGSQGAQFYAGPKDKYRLADIAPWLDRTIDFGWLWFIASPIHWLLTQINSVVGNHGVAILLLTLVVKLVFWKLSATSYRSMANMRRVMPKMNQLKERYGDDKMKLQKETMELYKKEKINPFGGCLPILVQMPVFIALYWVLLESVELRHAPFMLWIDDLSVMDPYFVLPLMMGAAMYLQFALNPTPQDPMQAKIMKFMPVVMTLFFLWFPAGLVLYWLANSVLGIAQQYYITKQVEKEYAEKEARQS